VSDDNWGKNLYAHTADHLESMGIFSEPLSGFEEQNYLHTMLKENQGLGYAAAVNRELNGGL